MRGFTQERFAHLLHPGAGVAGDSHQIEFFLSILSAFSLSDFYLELSTRDEDARRRQFIGSDEDWAAATKALQDACAATGLDLVPDPGGAAFSGQRCRFRSRMRLTHRQMSTIQYDFNQPERFDLEYTANGRVSVPS